MCGTAVWSGVTSNHLRDLHTQDLVPPTMQSTNELIQVSIIRLTLCLVTLVVEGGMATN